MSFVKRLFGRAIKSDDSADCQTATETVGDCNGNVPPSAWSHDPSMTLSTWSARRCRHRSGHVVLVCQRCGGSLSPAVNDHARGWSLSRAPRDYRGHAADDGVEAVCCCVNCSHSPCYQHRSHHPRVSIAYSVDLSRQASFAFLVVLVVQRFGVGLVIERSLVRLPTGALSSQLGQLILPSLWVGKSSTSLHGWG